ncbi:Uncharacterised protein [Candidatus Tiddalikarchaeum anstoanum]|nr:Uncharacterised protein [Candidatus Tiddalikarchaeum anstoanum]
MKESDHKFSLVREKIGKIEENYFINVGKIIGKGFEYNTNVESKAAKKLITADKESKEEKDEAAEYIAKYKVTLEKSESLLHILEQVKTSEKKMKSIVSATSEETNQYLKDSLIVTLSKIERDLFGDINSIGAINQLLISSYNKRISVVNGVRRFANLMSLKSDLINIPYLTKLLLESEKKEKFFENNSDEKSIKSLLSEFLYNGLKNETSALKDDLDKYLIQIDAFIGGEAKPEKPESLKYFNLELIKKMDFIADKNLADTSIVKLREQLDKIRREKNKFVEKNFEEKLYNNLSNEVNRLFKEHVKSKVQVLPYKQEESVLQALSNCVKLISSDKEIKALFNDKETMEFFINNMGAVYMNFLATKSTSEYSLPKFYVNTLDAHDIIDSNLHDTKKAQSIKEVITEKSINHLTNMRNIVEESIKNNALNGLKTQKDEYTSVEVANIANLMNDASFSLVQKLLEKNDCSVDENGTILYNLPEDLSDSSNNQVHDIIKMEAQQLFSSKFQEIINYLIDTGVNNVDGDGFNAIYNELFQTRIFLK